MIQTKQKHRIILAICFLVLFYTLIPNPSYAQNGSSPTIPTKEISFLKVQGQKIVDQDKKEFKIRGIVFHNDVWSNPKLPVQTHHNEEDFKKIRAMGFNTVYFYLNYQLFEINEDSQNQISQNSDSQNKQYKDTGFQWLNQNIKWAKKHNIRLIFCMAVAPGHPGSPFAPEESFSIWSNTKEQKRLSDLWGEIAKRYVKEPTVMGYSLLLYPNPKFKLTPWDKLSQKITSEIRANHSPQIIFIRNANIREQVIKYKSLDTGVYFGSAKDPLKNTVYEFSFYDSFEFCFQGLEFAGKEDISLRYPNPEKIYTGGDAKWESATLENPLYSPQKNSWQYLEGVPTQVNDSKMVYGYPTFSAKNTGNRGMVWADGIEIKEYNKDKKYLQTIIRLNTDQDERWYFWKKEGNGEGYIDTKTGYNSSNSLTIRGTRYDANLSCPDMKFPLTQGHYYQISGYVKGKLLSSKCEAQLRVDFYSIKKGIHRFNKEYLASRIDTYKKWGVRRNVPVFICEFGTSKPSLAGDWGGLRWVNDVLDICKEKNIGFTYNGYRDTYFGLYTNQSNQVAEKPNHSLIDLFTSQKN